MAAAVIRYRSSWSRPMFPQDVAFNVAVSQVAPDAASLEALAMVATYLHTVAPEGVIPDDSKLEDLKESVRGLLGDVANSDDLPADVRSLVIARLSDILRALEHLATTGPEAVRVATEALAGSVGLRATEAMKSPLWKRISPVVAAVYVAFAAGPNVEKSLNAWTNMATGELSSGATQSAQPPASEEK